MLQDNINPDLVRRIDGLPYLYDPTRALWLSVNMRTYTFAIDHRNIGCATAMQFIAELHTNVNGPLVEKNGILVSLSVRCQNNANANFNLYKNNDSLVRQIVLSGVNFGKLENLSDLLSEDDWLGCNCEPISGNVDFPVLQATVAWREN